jgi:hypothetical protein
MTLTLTILLGFFLGAGLILAISLSYLERQKWMRMLSEKQGIPIDIMEGKDRGAQAGVVPVPQKPARQRFAVPIPGADWMRNPKDRRDPT